MSYIVQVPIAQPGIVVDKEIWQMVKNIGAQVQTVETILLIPLQTKIYVLGQMGLSLQTKLIMWVMLIYFPVNQCGQLRLVVQPLLTTTLLWELTESALWVKFA